MRFPDARRRSLRVIGTRCTALPSRPQRWSSRKPFTVFSEWVCSASTRSVWSGLSHRRFALCEKLSGEGLSRSKRSAVLNNQLETAVNQVGRRIAKIIKANQIKSVRLASLLACFALVALSEKARAQGVDNPLPLKLGVTHKVKLFEDEQNHVRVSLPAGQYKAILDSRRTEGDSGNMTGSLSILNSDGAVTNENVIWFNYIDIVCRGVYTFSLKAPKTLILRLSNGANRQTFWLTLLREPETSFLPFCDEVAPKPIKI